MFAQIYYHKTNRALEAMIDDIHDLLDKGDWELFPAETVDELIHGYCRENDDSFLRMLCGEDPRLRDVEPVNSLAKRIADRHKLYKRLHETTSAVSAERMRAALVQCRQSSAERLRVAKSPLEATKDLGKGAVLLRRDHEGRYAAPALKKSGNADAGEDWRDASPIIQTLHLEERRIERLYWTGVDDDEYRQLRGLVQSISGA